MTRQRKHTRKKELTDLYKFCIATKFGEKCPLCDHFVIGFVTFLSGNTNSNCDFFPIEHTFGLLGVAVVAGALFG